ncbi:choice-of-anchor D domain-containing protein [Candidatus Albibeggiatoa sp. nov. NOAA]|uniref:choice-of-anchor D domain-containing protein n=1 Tax=Candidatus Albibeggiatoa sp. nov. NOAA TaxID=3162724 RepID=UPI0032FE5A93|nr:choice-of-anchor D domain-containing protein [Thiotrichaceae bacterium]
MKLQHSVPIGLLALWRFLLVLFASGFSLSAYADVFVTPSFYNYGDTAVNSSSAPKSFAVANQSPNSVTFKQINAYAHVGTIKPVDALGTPTTVYTSTDFFIISDNCSNQTYGSTTFDEPNCFVEVTFEPTSLGEKEASLIILYDELGTPNTYVAPLNGISVELPEAKLKPAENIDFGTIEVGAISTNKRLSISNDGKGKLKLSNMQFSSPDFVVQDFCSNTSVNYFGSCSLNVAFQPTSAGQKRAEIIFTTNDPAKPEAKFIVEGNGFAVEPNISISFLDIDFGTVNIGDKSSTKIIQVKNTGSGVLKLGEISIPDNGFIVETAFCNNKTLRSGSACSLIAYFEPSVEGEALGQIEIPSNDPDTSRAEVNMQGIGAGWCTGNYQKETYIYPQTPDFGTELVGNQTSTYAYFSSYARGCDALEITDIQLIGANANEFQLTNQQCYNGSWENNSYASCSFNAVFKPSTAGSKSAHVQFTLSDSSSYTMDLTATAVSSGQPAIELSPTTLTFDPIIVGFSSYQYELIQVKNTGNINLKISDTELVGTDAENFEAYNWGCAYQALKPGQVCSLYAQFNPVSAGTKTASLVLNAAGATAEMGLTGTATAPISCDDANVTIETVGSVWDHRWAEKVNGEYTGATFAWQRKGNLQAGEEASPNTPREGDVVKINSGHSINGIPLANIRALCIEQGAELTSPDILGTPLEIRATELIQNDGVILGFDGANEMQNVSCSAGNVGSGNCAYPGASVILKVGTGASNNSWYSYTSGGPIINNGEIIAGKGGDATHYAADGGNAIVLGRGMTNKSIIQAGNGGDITQTGTGRAGNGGVAQIWGKLGGSGHLRNQNGAQALAGDGGRCRVRGGNQTAGAGGNLRLIASRLYLNGGIHAAGQSGTGCAGFTPRDGYISIDPSLISLAGANTRISGGDIKIYGGEDWILDMSNIGADTIQSTGNITLSVGKNSKIDFTGVDQTILQAAGQVTILADEVILDDGVQLTDMIEAENIVVAPAEILREVSVGAPKALAGDPLETVTINVTVANNGPEADTYSISAVDTAGWSISSVSDAIEVPALEAIDLSLTVTLPATRGENSNLTITAISQADPDARATATVQLSVVTETAGLPVEPSPVTIDPNNPSAPACTGGAVGSACSNGGTITDANIDDGASISGGNLEGTVVNNGIISQVNIVANTVVNGGKASGSITIEDGGVFNDFEFVGAELRGGTLGGNIINSSTVGGIFIDVTFSANATVTGGALQGQISGDMNAPTLLTNVTIKSGTVISGVIIGEGTIYEDGVVFGRGIRFGSVELMPFGIAVTPLLPEFTVTLPDNFVQPLVVNLTADVIAEGDGVLSAMNNLLVAQGWTLVQHPVYGYLQLDLDGVRFAIQTWDVQQTFLDATALVTPVQSIEFITDTNLRVITHPVTQAPDTLYDVLSELATSANLGTVSIDVSTNGNFSIATSVDTANYLSVRASLGAEATDLEVGLYTDTLPATFVYVEDEQAYGQVYYPAPADMDALIAAAEDVRLLESGELSFTFEGETYVGTLDYVVSRGDETGSFSVETDGSQFVLTYPNGDTQVMSQ